MRKHYLSTVALLVMVVLAAGSVDTGNNGTSTPSTGGSSTSTKKWYEGGTLHNKSALDMGIAIWTAPQK